MATDLRDGLWTFFEDIRQATVGEEGVNGTATSTNTTTRSPAKSTSRPGGGGGRPGNKGSITGSLKSTGSSRAQPNNNKTAAKSTAPAPPRRSNDRSSPPLDVAANTSSFWQDLLLNEPKAAAPPKVVRPGSRGKASKSSTSQLQPLHPQRTAAAGGAKKQKGKDADQHHHNDTDEDENWDYWDTPIHAASNHTSPRPHPQAQRPNQPPRASERTLPPTTHNANDAADVPLRYGGWDTPAKDSIPWPAIVKPFTPSSLRRTASHLMSEWERSLTPPGEEGESYMSVKRGRG